MSIDTVGQRRARWMPTVAAVMGIALTASAGTWQLNRAHEKEARQAVYDRGEADAPVALGGAPVRAEDLRFRRIEVRGRFVTEATVLLDNKVHDKIVGYHVVMPLKIEGSTTHVLVNRGWVAAGRERSALPTIRTPASTVHLTGVVVVPGRFIELSDAATDGLVWQNLTVERFRLLKKLDVLPLIVEQYSELDDGLVRSWNRPDFGIAKHYGYAVQWFSLCTLIIFLYIFFHVRRARPKENQENVAAPGCH